MQKYLNEFLIYSKLLNKADKTISNYKSILNLFFSFLKNEFNIDKLKNIDKTNINAFQQYLVTKISNKTKKTIDINTQAKHLYIIKSFFSFLVKNDFIFFNPTKDIQIPLRQHKLPDNILTEQEMCILLQQPDIATIQGYRDRTIIEIFYSTGIRSKEMINLKISNPDINNNILSIIQGKGKKDRIVPLTDSAAEFLEGYILNIRKKLLRGKPSNILIIQNNGNSANNKFLLRTLRRYAKKANINKKIGCHTLRHSCATHLLKNGAGIRYIQQLLGHSSLETTKIYTKIEIKDLKRIHKKYHPREKF